MLGTFCYNQIEFVIKNPFEQPMPQSPLVREIKTLLALMLPIFITQFAQAGFGLIDTVMAGHLSAADLAAIAVGVSLWLPTLLLCSGLMMATAPLIAEAVGAKHISSIATITHQSLWLALLTGIVGAMALWCAPLMFDVIQVPLPLRPKVSLFLQSIALGIPAVTLYTVLRAYCEALGHPRVVTVISLLALVVLIPLNYMFMYGCFGISGFGGAGAGIANAILQWLMLAVLVSYVKYGSRFKHVPLFKQFELPHFQWLKRISALGLPIGLAIFFEVSIFSSAALVISPLGEFVVAAHQIAISVTTQLFMLPLSLSFALTILVGRYYGAKDWNALRRVQRLGLMVATVIACITMLALLLFRDQIIQMYSEDARVYPIAFSLVGYAVAYQLMDAWQVTATGCLRGIQDTRMPMWITLFAYWVVAFPLGVYLTRYAGFSAAGVWIGLIVGLSFACVLLISRLWQRNRDLIAQHHD